MVWWRLFARKSSESKDRRPKRWLMANTINHRVIQEVNISLTYFLSLKKKKKKQKPPPEKMAKG